MREEYTINLIKYILRFKYVYTVYIKVRYSGNKYFMLGDQWGFEYYKMDDLKDIFDDMKQKKYFIILKMCIN